ncbi:MAG TPA: hypothetical protein VGM39_25490 [Kofleriaceae bacterium]|jgi:hypothetical protein
MRIALATLLLSGVAYADTAEQVLARSQLQLDAVRDPFDESDHTTPYVRAAGYASLLGGNQRDSGLSAGAAVAATGAGCNSVDASALVRLQPLNDQPVEASVDWHICVLRAVLTLEFGGTRRVGIAPAIDARTSLWARRYNETYNDVTMGVGDIPSDDAGHNRHAVFQFTFGHGTTEQQDGDDARRTVPLDGSLVAYRFRHLTEHPVSIEALVIDFNALKAGDSDLGAVTVTISPLNASFDHDGIFGALRFGWTTSGGTAVASGSTEVNGETTSSWSEAIDGTGLADLTRFVGEATLGGRDGGWEYSGTASRALFPTFDGDLGFDERVTGRLGYARGKTSLTFSPFLAHSQIWRRDAGTQESTSYGATASVGHELTPVLRFDAIGQLAKSPYARLDGDREPTDSLGGQVLVALSAHRTTQR